MADLEGRLARAREHVAPDWTPERERDVHERIRRGEAASARRRRVSLVVAVAAAVAAAVAFVRAPSVALPPRAAPVALQPTPEVPGVKALLELADGSVVTAVSADARVEPVQVTEANVAVRLTAGRARFSVAPNPARTFRVLAADATVTVLGTVFTVGLEGGRASVSVERGRVSLVWPAGERVLGVGETATADPFAAGGEPAPAEAAALEPRADASPARPGISGRTAQTGHGARAGEGAPSWRALAEDGEYARAFDVLSRAGEASVRDEPGDLLLAADVARLGGHPEVAVRRLERVVSAHASDSRAPLASFTLGRTLLDQLGRPREAASAFAAARRLAPGGALAQDALAREVESWSRAGDATLSSERAREYVRLYPDGRRIEAVRRLGGLR